jgi:class 3 adenylate cyclase
LRIGAGIATGQVIAGYTGTQRRATYTCVGDTVNVAARLETHTRVSGRDVLMDLATRQALPDAMVVEPLGRVLLKGKLEPVEVFALSR